MPRYTPKAGGSFATPPPAVADSPTIPVGQDAWNNLGDDIYYRKDNTDHGGHDATNIGKLAFAAIWATATSGIQPPDTWHALTLSNGWGNYAGVQGAQYMLDAMGFVHVRGVISGGTTTLGTTIATLPAAYRPANGRVFAVGNAGVATDLYVQANGVIVINTSGCSSTQMSIEMIFEAGW